MAEVSKEPRSTTFLRQRLSVAVQRGNAACILGTLRGSSKFKLEVEIDNNFNYIEIA